jgi:hypothetical protein
LTPHGIIVVELTGGDNRDEPEELSYFIADGATCGGTALTGLLQSNYLPLFQ